MDWFDIFHLPAYRGPVAGPVRPDVSESEQVLGAGRGARFDAFTVRRKGEIYIEKGQRFKPGITAFAPEPEIGFVNLSV